jgi:hypothetical protein
MAYRAMNAAGVPLQTLSIEMPVERYRALRIAAAEQNMVLTKFVRGLLEDFLATRYAMRQIVAEDFSGELNGVDQFVVCNEEV